MVSIVLVTYNRAARLKLSIQDILQQTFQNFELIICDDCSTDDTPDVCAEFAEKDSRVKYFRHAANKEMPGNCNFGITQAKHDYVAILHDGDRFRDDLIQQWYNAISANDSVAFVFNSIADTDGNDRITNVFCEFPEGIVPGDKLLKSVFFRRPHFDSPVYGEAMVRKELVLEYGLMKKEFGFYSDVDLWMELLQNHNAYHCADPLILCPKKSVQPQQFSNDLMKFNMFMLAMHRKHRIKAYKGNLLPLLREMTIFHAFALYHTTYSLLLVIKNFPFKYFLRSAGRIWRYPAIVLVWSLLLVTYPFVKSVLWTPALLVSARNAFGSTNSQKHGGMPSVNSQRS
jgi:glycosyltransferase involved in cell wall biosynthesis